MKMKAITDIYLKKPQRPVRIVQFGEGCFLRAFADWMVDILNEKTDFNGSVAIVKPRSIGGLEAFENQNSLYTVILRGVENKQTVCTSRVITSVNSVTDTGSWDNLSALAKCPTVRFVISNTTEAGIALDKSDRMDGVPSSYPGKLTKFLYERYVAFDGDPSRGVIILPTELIEDNGKRLSEYVLTLSEIWGLPIGFTEWISAYCTFCSTLVDRIVTGYPKSEVEMLWKQIGYKDELLDIGEPFALWVIESERDIRPELPLDLAGLPVIFTEDQKPYRDRKVRILNGSHTSFVPAAFLSGEEIVRDCMTHPVIRPFIDTCIYHEIIPTLCESLDKEELLRFADAVCERFENPFIDHALISICLNSVSKWKARVLPSLLDSLASGNIPHCLILSFSALCKFYASVRMTDGKLVGTRTVNGVPIPYTVSDSKSVLDFFAENGLSSDILLKFAARTDFWDIDLSSLQGFSELAQNYYDLLSERGILAAMEEAVSASRR